MKHKKPFIYSLCAGIACLAYYAITHNPIEPFRWVYWPSPLRYEIKHTVENSVITHAGVFLFEPEDEWFHVASIIVDAYNCEDLIPDLPRNRWSSFFYYTDEVVYYLLNKDGSYTAEMTFSEYKNKAETLGLTVHAADIPDYFRSRIMKKEPVGYCS